MNKTLENNDYKFLGIVAFLSIVYFVFNTSSVISATTVPNTASTTDEVTSYEVAKKESINVKHTKSTESTAARFEPSLEVVQGNFKIHTDRRVGYTVKYPKEWRSYEIPSMDYAVFENVDVDSLDSSSKEINDNYFKIEVIKFARNNLALDKWVDRQNIESYTVPKILERYEMKVSGYPAIYQMEQFGYHISPAIFVSKGDYVYIINPSSNKPEFEKTIDDFIGNLSFN